MARPPSAAYQFSKFGARWHRGLVVAGVGVGAAAPVGGAGVAGWQAYVATRARGKDAQGGPGGERGGGAFRGVHHAALDGRGHGQDVTVCEALRTAWIGSRRRSTINRRCRTRAVVRHTLGMLYRRGAGIRSAERECRKSLELRRANLPPDHPQVAAGGAGPGDRAEAGGAGGGGGAAVSGGDGESRKSGTKGEMVQCGTTVRRR